MLKRILNLIWLILLVIGVSSFANAQDTTNPLQDAVDEAEARAKIAKAQKEELDAKFPKPDASALVGGTTIKGDFIEAKMLGYCAMKRAANSISNAIIAKNFNNPKFIIYSEADVKMLSRYQLMIQRLTILENGYTTLCAGGGCNNAGGVRIQGIGVGLVANKALEFLSLLKTDIDITGTEFDIGEKELVAEVFNNYPIINFIILEEFL